MGDHRIVKEKSKEGRYDPRIREGLGKRPKMYLFFFTPSFILFSPSINFYIIYIYIYTYFVIFMLSCYYNYSCILFDIEQTWRAMGNI